MNIIIGIRLCTPLVSLIFRTDTITRIWKLWLKEDTGYNYKYMKLYRATEGNFLGVGGTADLIVRIKDDSGNNWFMRTRATVIKVQ